MSGMFRSVLLDLPVFVEVQKMWQRNVSLLQEEMSGMFRSVLLDLPVPDDVRHLSMQTLHELRPDTSREAADEILKEQYFRRGPGGMVGGAIYFAKDPDHTHRKAHSFGVILKCQVMLGNPKTVNNKYYKDFTYSELLDQGYDSVILTHMNT
eukprot:gene7738-11892_t